MANIMTQPPPHELWELEVRRRTSPSSKSHIPFYKLGETHSVIPSHPWIIENYHKNGDPMFSI